MEYLINKQYPHRSAVQENRVAHGVPCWTQNQYQLEQSAWLDHFEYHSLLE
jgi:hypothetical protein